MLIHSNKYAGWPRSTTCRCTKAIYCDNDCKEADAKLHQLLCQQAEEIVNSNGQDENDIQIIILHAQEIKAELAWATITDAGLKIDHPAINSFKLSQEELVPVPDLINYQLQNFKLTKWLGQGVLLWTMVNWAELPIEWVNRTAIFMGGKPGQSNLFYGPMIVTVFRQDIVHLNMRTPDHVQMRTLRQVADYIQMVDDNPCVPNPIRFESVPPSLDPLPDLAPIPGVKINDKLELALMSPFGMTDPKEEIFVALKPRRLEQCPAAVPFLLGLKWYTRFAKLDVLTEKPRIAERVDDNLAWFQWTLNLVPDATRSNQQKVSAEYAHHDRSLVVVHAGGAPLRIDHIEALTMYVGLRQSNDKDRANVSEEGFQEYWKEIYANTQDAPPSPYQLEAGYPDNFVEPGADETMASLTKNKEEIKGEIMNMTPVRVEVLVKRLIKTYEQDRQVVRIIQVLISHCIDGKSLKNVQLEVVSEPTVCDRDLEALRVVKALTRTYSRTELCQMAEYINEYEEGYYLGWFKRHEIK